MHQNIPPQIPPFPPPPGVPQIMWPSVMIHHIPNMEFIFGKWTDASMVAEGMGCCLWQHDWGLALIHVSVPFNPQMSVCLTGSCLKLQLPASTDHQKATGGAIHAGEEAPHAACFSSGFIIAQSCWDRGGFPFVAPTGFHFSSPSTVLVDVKTGDIAAAVLGFIGDLLATMAGGMFGKRFSSLFEEMHYGEIATAAAIALFGASGRTKLIGDLIIGVGTLGGLTVGLFRGPTEAEIAEAAQSGVDPWTERLLTRSGQGIAAMGLTVGSALCDWGAESVQGKGSVVGDGAPQPSPQQ